MRPSIFLFPVKRPEVLRRSLFLFLLMVAPGSGALFGQSITPSTLNIPTLNSMSGATPLISVQQNAREQLSLPSGALDLSIPIVSLPQKGGRSLSLGFLYSTNETYTLKQEGASFEVNSVDADDNGDATFYAEDSLSAGWVQNTKGPFGSFYVNLPTLSADRIYYGENKNVCGNGKSYCYNAPFCLQGWVFKDSSGVSHTFAGFDFCDGAALNIQGNQSSRLSQTTAYSTDGMGFQLDLRNAGDLMVRGPDGTLYHFPAGPPNHESDPSGSLSDDTAFNAYAQVFTAIVDPNGNTITATRNLQDGSYAIVDTMGRNITIGPGASSITWQQQSSISEQSKPQTASLSQIVASSATADFPVGDDICQAKYVQKTGTYNGPQFTMYPAPTGLPAETSQTLTLPDGTSYKLTLNVFGQISRIDYPSGGYTRYDYAVVGNSGLVDQGDMSCTKSFRSVIAKHVCPLANGTCVVSPPLNSASDCHAGVAGGEQTTCYNGTTGQYYWTTLNVTDPVGNQVEHDFQTGAGPLPNGGGYTNPDELTTVTKTASGQALRTVKVIPSKYPGCGYPLAISMYVNAGPPYCSRTTTLNDASPALSTTETILWQLPGLPRSVIVEDFSGNVLRTDTAQYESAGIYALANTAAGSTALANVLDHVQSTTSSDSVKGLQSNSTNTYDATANLIQVDRSGTNAPTASTKVVRDPAGNITNLTDPMQFAGQHTGSTALAYGTQSIGSCPQNSGPGLPTSVINALNQSTLYAYYDSGRVACIEDPNGQITTFSYDALGRTTEVDNPDGGHTTTSYPPSLPLTVTETTVQDSTYSPSQQTVLDGLGRMSQQISLSPAEGQTCVETFYDPVGRVTATSYPRIGCLGTLVPSSSVQYGFDALDRQTSQTNGDGSSVSWAYAGAVVDSYDEIGNHMQHTSDSLGRLSSVSEPDVNNVLASQTQYSYDGFGNLWSVGQSGVSGETARQPRSFTYDGLSRLLTASNPEAGQLCYGTLGPNGCQSGYDLNGNLQFKTDARSTTTSTFDALNRTTGKSFSDGTPSSCFIFDSAPGGGTIPNSTGRLTAEWTQPGTCGAQNNIPSTAFTWTTVGLYDVMGRRMQETQCPFAPCSSNGPGTIANVVQYTYDFTGAITSSTNGMAGALSPGIQFFYHRDEAGRPQSVTSTWDSASTYPMTLFKADGSIGATPYGPFGLVAAQLGIPSAAQQPALSRSKAFDYRGRILQDTYVPGAGAASIIPPPSTQHIQITINPSPVPAGETAIATTSCDATCGSGDGAVFVDDQLVGGFTYNSGDQDLTELPSDLTPTSHTFYVQYKNSADGSLTTSAKVPFQVVNNTLPDPGMTIDVNPKPIPQGESGEIEITLACGTQCGAGGGNVYVNGTFSGGFEIDENGSAVTYTSNALVANNYTLRVDWFGNGTVRQSSQTASFTVAPLQLPEGVVSASISPLNIPEGQYGQVAISDKCQTSCGGGQYFIDGNFAGGFYLGDSGTASVPIYPGLKPGPHVLTLSYTGNEDFAPSNPAGTNFTVIPNTLSPPQIAVSIPTPVPIGQWVQIPMVLTPPSDGVSCAGQGQVFVDGQYSDSFFVQDDNSVIGNVTPSPQMRPVTAAGTHEVDINYFGNSNCRYLPLSLSFTAQ